MALDFDGVDDKVDHGDIAAFDLASAYTIMFWIKLDVSGVNETIIDKGADPTFAVFCREVSQTLRVAVDGTANRFDTTATVMTTGTWVHLTMWFNGGGVGNSNRLRVYTNGINEAGTYAGTVPATSADGGANTVLVAGGSGVGFVDAKIALLKAWSIALSDAEILQEIWSYRPVRTANIILWAPYVDGTNARDYSGTGNHGTVTGASQTDGPPVGGGIPIQG